VFLNEDFTFQDDGWNAGSRTLLQDGKAVLKAEKGLGLTELYDAMRFGDIDLCVTVKMTKRKDSNSTAASAGAIFWAKDTKNHTIVQIAPSGDASVLTLVNNAWTTIIPPRQFDALKTAVGDSNTIRVVLKGNTGTAYINGKRFAGFRGQPPGKNNAAVGFYAQSESGFENSWEFTQLKVTDLPK
jgi:Domain of Unknown Function (DUF1080)